MCFFFRSFRKARYIEHTDNHHDGQHFFFSFFKSLFNETLVLCIYTCETSGSNEQKSQVTLMKRVFNHITFLIGWWKIEQTAVWLIKDIELIWFFLFRSEIKSSCIRRLVLFLGCTDGISKSVFILCDQFW